MQNLILILENIEMKPLKIGSSSKKRENIITQISSNSPASIKKLSEAYVDYTNFQDGFIMVFDEERNRLHFISPDEILDEEFIVDYGIY